VGYLSSFHLVDVKIKEDCLEIVNDALSIQNGDESSELEYFQERAVLDSDNFLCFTPHEDGSDPYEPCEDDGTIPAIYGKWYDGEELASWLKQYCEEGGKMIFHSIEGDGDAWGWEFDGQGSMRDLQLCSVGEWE
jgi:hypothetical protein